MMPNSPQKKAIALSALLAAVYLLHGISGPVSAIFLTITSGETLSLDFLRWYFIITFVMAAAFYLPLAICVNRLAKKACMKVLKIISIVIIIPCCVFVALGAVVIIAALISPGIPG